MIPTAKIKCYLGKLDHLAWFLSQILREQITPDLKRDVMYCEFSVRTWPGEV